MVEYKEDATDGDDDGFVQDATPFERPVAKKKDPVVNNTGLVKIISKRNLYWEHVGRLRKGLNEVTPELAEKWLTLPTVSKA